MANRTWAAGAWDDTPQNGDTLIIQDHSTVPAGEDVPSAGTYNLTFNEVLGSQTEIAAADYIGAGNTLGVVLVDNENGQVAVAQDFDGAFVNAKSSMLRIAASCASTKTIRVAGVLASLSISANCALTIVPTAGHAGVENGLSGGEQIEMGAGAQLIGSIEADFGTSGVAAGTLVAWTDNATAMDGMNQTNWSNTDLRIACVFSATDFNTSNVYCKRLYIDTGCFFANDGNTLYVADGVICGPGTVTDTNTAEACVAYGAIKGESGSMSNITFLPHPQQFVRRIGRVA